TLGYVGNPIDPWGATDERLAYPLVLEAFAASGAYDVLAIVHDFPYRSLASEVAVARGVAGALVEATSGRPGILPVYISLTSGEPTPEIVAQLDLAGGIPVLRGTTESLAAIAGRASWEAHRTLRLEMGPRRPGWPALAADRTPLGRDPTFQPDQPGGISAATRTRVLPERESLALLGAAGLPVVAATPVAGVRAAVRAAESIGFPVALKVDASGLAHKSDIRGVRLGLADRTAVTGAAVELLALDRAGIGLRGLLVEPMVGPGVELIVGLRRDAQFGPIVLVGLGGTLAEILDDVVLELAPLSAAIAGDMLDRLRGAPILAGARGRPPIDRAALIELIVGLGRLGWQRSDLLEVDLNPVIAQELGVIAVDALVVHSEA
ncbi:MAG: acetate--CoA ligase family protein, partial [Candidatus Limnocylindrales bacterium]